MTAYERLLELAGDDVKRRGPRESDLLCPGHDDHKASLSLGVATKLDGAVADCKAGCDVETVMARWRGGELPIAALFDSWWDRRDGAGERPAPWGNGSLGAAAGARLPSLLPDESELGRWAGNLQRDHVALAAIHEAKGWRPDVLAALGVGIKGDRYTIPVRSRGGALVNLLRYRPGASTKMLALKGHPRTPLYALVDDDGPVFVGEGETDALSLAHVAVNAIGLPGAGVKVRPEWLEPVRGRMVYVPVDNDDSGRGWARRCAAVAHELASETRLVEFHGSTKGYDVGDFLREHCDDPDRGRAALLELVAAAPQWRPEATEVPDGDVDGEHLHDDTSVGRIRRALFEDTESTRAGSDVVREPVPETGGLLWRGLAHSVFGDRGEGKSITVVIVTVSAAVAGERVLYLDRENGPALTRSLVEGVLEAHPDWPDVLDGGEWTGRHYPAFSREWEPADYAEAIAGCGYTGVVYDSVREVISELGGNPNAEEDYSTLQRVLVTPLLRRGVWVVLLDNVGHLDKQRPKGTGAKLDAVPIAYQVRTTHEFGPTIEGAVEVNCTRSRYGDTGREWVVRLGAGRFDVAEARDDESPDERAARELDEKRTRWTRDVVEELGRDGPLGAKKLLERVKGARKDTMREWLAELVADPAGGITHDERVGYSLKDPPEGVSQGGAPRSPKGSRTPRTPQGGEPIADDASDEAVVERMKREFNAVEVDEHDNLIGGER